MDGRELAQKQKQDGDRGAVFAFKKISPQLQGLQKPYCKQCTTNHSQLTHMMKTRGDLCNL